MKEATQTFNGYDGNYTHRTTTIKTPNYVGGYILGDTNRVQFNLTHKPNWFHRTMVRLCFGWKWVNL
jgi:hypothetical protein